MTAEEKQLLNLRSSISQMNFQIKMLRIHRMKVKLKHIYIGIEFFTSQDARGIFPAVFPAVFPPFKKASTSFHLKRVLYI